MVAFILASGAPSSPLTWELVSSTAKNVSAASAVAVLALAIAIAVTLQPLQFRLVQLLEGYWPNGPHIFFRIGIAIQRRRYERLQDQLTGELSYASEVKERAANERMQMAELRLIERFPKPERLLPTALGNALRSSEDRAGKRYGAEAVVLWPRLYPLLPVEMRAAVEDEVNQLDVSARLTITWLVTAVASCLCLLRDPTSLTQHPSWLVVPTVTCLLAWLSYQAAIESAVAHGLDIEVALDLHRSLLVSAMRLPEPGRLSVERRTMERLCQLFQTDDEGHSIELDYKPRAPGTT